MYMRRAYCASDLGFTQSGRYYLEEVYLPKLREVVEIVDPWSLVPESEFIQAKAEGRSREHALEVGRGNLQAIDSCEILIALLEGQEIDSGTASEIGYASGRGLTCWGLRSDHRQAGEPGVQVNLQVESLITVSGGSIAGTLDELCFAVGITQSH
jgi:nucleoside 2-deoxyribosyltransferase